MARSEGSKWIVIPRRPRGHGPSCVWRGGRSSRGLVAAIQVIVARASKWRGGSVASEKRVGSTCRTSPSEQFARLYRHLRPLEAGRSYWPGSPPPSVRTLEDQRVPPVLQGGAVAVQVFHSWQT